VLLAWPASVQRGRRLLPRPAERCDEASRSRTKARRVWVGLLVLYGGCELCALVVELLSGV